MNQPISVKGVLLRNLDGASEVLLLRNGRNEWELPGGRPEAGETPQECLAREIREETGLAVEVGSSIYNGVLTILPPHTPKATDVWIAAYACRLTNSADSSAPIALSSEHQGAAWIGVEDLAAMNDVPAIYRAAVESGMRAAGL